MATFALKSASNGYPFVTKSDVRARIATGELSFLATCLFILVGRQTDDEKTSRSTKYDNKVGLMCSHASNGVKLADKLQAGEPLSGEEHDKLIGIVSKYTKQLAASFRAEQMREMDADALQVASVFGVLAS